MRDYLYETHQSKKKKKVALEKLVKKKRQKIFNICLIDVYVDNSFVDVRKLILTDKNYKCWLKNGGNSLTYV